MIGAADPSDPMGAFCRKILNTPCVKEAAKYAKDFRCSMSTTVRRPRPYRELTIEGRNASLHISAAEVIFIWREDGSSYIDNSMTLAEACKAFIYRNKRNTKSARKNPVPARFVYGAFDPSSTEEGIDEFRKKQAREWESIPKELQKLADEEGDYFEELHGGWNFRVKGLVVSGHNGLIEVSPGVVRKGDPLLYRGCSGAEAAQVIRNAFKRKQPKAVR